MKYSSITICFVLLWLSCDHKPPKEASITVKKGVSLVRNAHAMAYNSDEALIYLFGGANEEEVLSGLWVLDNTLWRKVITNTQPEARTFGTMIYDDQNQRLLLFGGSKVLFGTASKAENLLNDTWQFKDNQWKRLRTDHAPTPRTEAMMAYDRKRETVVLFGGYVIENGKYVKLGDTWEFRDNDWHLTSESGPSDRHGVSMAYDSENETVVLYGGSTVDKQYGPGKGETWKWNEKKWAKFDTEQPEGVFNAAMAYDHEYMEFIRFGGWNGETRINETWRLHQGRWSRIETSNSPAARNHSSMVYDAGHKRMVLFGGHDGEHIFGDIWEFRNQNWKRISDTQPIKRIANSH